MYSFYSLPRNRFFSLLHPHIPSSRSGLSMAFSLLQPFPLICIFPRLTCNRRWHIFSNIWSPVPGTSYVQQGTGFPPKLLLQHAPVACLIASRIRLSLYHFRYSTRSVDNDVHFYSFQLLLSNFRD